MIDRIKSFFGLETEPRWKRRPEFYYCCPDCEQVAVNAKWRIKEKETDEVIFKHRGVTHYRREMFYLCPNCDELVPFDDVHSLDEIAYFQQKLED